MEIFLDKRAVRQIRISATDAIEEGDTETLREEANSAKAIAQLLERRQSLGQGPLALKCGCGHGLQMAG